MKDFFNSILHLIEGQEKNFTLSFPTGYQLTVTNINSENPNEYQMYMTEKPMSNKFRYVGDIKDIDLFRKAFYAK